MLFGHLDSTNEMKHFTKINIKSLVKLGGGDCVILFAYNITRSLYHNKTTVNWSNCLYNVIITQSIYRGSPWVQSQVLCRLFNVGIEIKDMRCSPNEYISVTGVWISIQYIVCMRPAYVRGSARSFEEVLRHSYDYIYASKAYEKEMKEHLAKLKVGVGLLSDSCIRFIQGTHSIIII